MQVMDKNKKIGVSIICNTYNQVDYIEATIKSFLLQKTSFDYEILIHDDCSNDGTKEIIESYANKYPNIIYPIYEKENQYSKCNIDEKFQYPRAKGKYIAYCEGDDFWIDENKLQKQYDYLESHNEINMSAHACMVIDADSLDLKYFIAPESKDKILTMKNVIRGGAGYLGTNTLFFRRELCNKIIEVGEFNHISDYSMQLSGADPNGVYYFKECMSAYRFMSKGSWSVKNKDNNNVKNAIINILNSFDLATNHKYIKYIDKEIVKNKDGESKLNKFLKDVKYHFVRKYYYKNLNNYIHSVKMLNEK